jgi:hypothetical protein
VSSVSVDKRMKQAVLTLTGVCLCVKLVASLPHIQAQADRSAGRLRRVSQFTDAQRNHGDVSSASSCSYTLQQHSTLCVKCCISQTQGGKLGKTQIFCCFISTLDEHLRRDDCYVTPCSRVPLEKPTVAHLPKKFTAFHGTQTLIAVFAKPRHRSLP